jgi:hypothetical protein
MAASLPTLHPVGLPDVQVRVIEYRIEPHTAERLASFPSSQTSNHPDPRQLHRKVPTLLDPQQAPALELINCYSFTHAVLVLDTACYEFALVARQELPRLKQRLLTDLREPSTLLPPRRLRFYPRVVNRAYSPFHRKRPGQQGFPLKKQSFKDILLI